MSNAGSKGINVSRVSILLGQKTCALGFIGGNTGQLLLQKLSEEGIESDFVHAENFNTRINVKVMDLSQRTVTDLNEPGDPVSQSEYSQLLDKYREKLNYADIVVISGSLLPEMTNRTYYDLIQIAHKYNKPVFLDCGGVVLKESLKASPYCIKPNLREFEEMFGGSKRLTEDEVLSESKKIIDKYNIKRVVVTLGANGVIGVTENEAYRIIPPDVTAASTVGAGDAFLAGMCYGYVMGVDFSKQLVLGTSCASAKVTKEGNDIPSLIELLGYTDNCRVIKLQV
jgi:1-phosphofructokinase family hexose kinase